jgi:hypothetical protein
MGVLDDVLDIADIYTTGSVNEELKEIAGFRDEKSSIDKRQKNKPHDCKRKT